MQRTGNGPFGNGIVCSVQNSIRPTAGKTAALKV